MRALLGGKGANLAEITRMLGADRIPPGFTISTEACVAYLRSGSRLPDGLVDQVDEAIESLVVWETLRTLCWCRCARAPASPCRGCSRRSSTSA